ncbi:MAG TPA: hypothetical protein VJB16_00305, partial [archaeon]|nr:hypothetical protein [archaeon]
MLLTRHVEDGPSDGDSEDILFVLAADACAESLALGAVIVRANCSGASALLSHVELDPLSRTIVREHPLIPDWQPLDASGFAAMQQHLSMGVDAGGGSLFEVGCALAVLEFVFVPELLGEGAGAEHVGRAWCAEGERYRNYAQFLRTMSGSVHCESRSATESGAIPPAPSVVLLEEATRGPVSVWVDAASSVGAGACGGRKDWRVELALQPLRSGAAFRAGWLVFDERMQVVLLESALLVARAWSPRCGGSASAAVTVEVRPQLPRVELHPEPAERLLTGPLYLTALCPDAGSRLRIALDGSNPLESGNGTAVFPGPSASVVVAADAVVRATAIRIDGSLACAEARIPLLFENGSVAEYYSSIGLGPAADEATDFDGV